MYLGVPLLIGTGVSTIFLRVATNKIKMVLWQNIFKLILRYSKGHSSVVSWLFQKLDLECITYLGLTLVLRTYQFWWMIFCYWCPRMMKFHYLHFAFFYFFYFLHVFVF